MREELIIGRRTRELIKGPCPELKAVGLDAVGRTDAAAPYRIFRNKMACGHIIATCEGEGEIWLADGWRRAAPGSIFLAPPGNLESFHAMKTGRWSFCWLHTLPEFFAACDMNAPVLVEADITLFRHAVEGFIHSALSKIFEKTAGAWADLIWGYGQRFLHADHPNVRLEALWAAVSADPARPWDTKSLCRLAGISREQLRVITRGETGRSPMQQVAFLRIQRAIEILRTQAYKQEAIAGMVGYHNAFSFSNAFLKITGRRPSFYRPGARD